MGSGKPPKLIFCAVYMELDGQQISTQSAPTEASLRRVNREFALRKSPDSSNAFDPRFVSEVIRLLETVWDPTGRILESVVHTPNPANPYQPRTYQEYAMVLCAMAAASSSDGDVMGYLRREEETFCGATVTTGHERGAVARGIRESLRIMRDTPSAHAQSVEDEMP